MWFGKEQDNSPLTVDARGNLSTKPAYASLDVAKMVRQEEQEKSRAYELELLRRSIDELKQTVHLLIQTQGYELYYTEYVPEQHPQLRIRKIKTK